jgi:acyl-CoA synthetase (AMP-forming)/AMP-acid ligase II
VAAAGVVGVPDQRLGQTIAAFLVSADPDRPPDPGDLRRHARARLAGFKVPVFWYLAGALPHSAAGKLLRRELAAWHDDPAAVGSVAELEPRSRPAADGRP